jgi:hypothetical protein
MPLIRMTKTTSGAERGIYSRRYHEGETYEVSPELAKTFGDMGVCERLEDAPRVPAKVEQDEDEEGGWKSRDAAPANKARGRPPANKGR